MTTIQSATKISCFKISKLNDEVSLSIKSQGLIFSRKALKSKFWRAHLLSLVVALISGSSVLLSKGVAYLRVNVFVFGVGVAFAVAAIKQTMHSRVSAVADSPADWFTRTPGSRFETCL